MRDSTGRYIFDGFFFDSVTRKPGDSDNGANGGPWDLARLGFSSDAMMNDATTAQLSTFFGKVKSGCPQGFKMYINPVTKADSYIQNWVMDGELVEGFDAATSFTEGRSFCLWTSPDIKLLKAEDFSGPPTYSASKTKQARFLLGTACLGDGWAYIHTGDNNFRNGFYDEYSVDEGGSSDTSGAHQGWLGQPLAPAYVQDGVWRRDFQNGVVLVDSTFATPMRVDLGNHSYRRISGTTDRSVNYGYTVRDVIVPPRDAIFLYKPSGQRAKRP
jgi:hypothetical protein